MKLPGSANFLAAFSMDLSGGNVTVGIGDTYYNVTSIPSVALFLGGLGPCLFLLVWFCFKKPGPP